MAKSKGGAGKKQRLDKILSHVGYGSRSELRKQAKQGLITVNGVAQKDSGAHVDPYNDTIEVAGEAVIYREHIYLMMNKPPGVLSATEDKRDRTVLDLLDERYAVFEPFPVGRLDKDTVGLLLLTSDGQLAHELLSPRKHVPKTYEALVEGEVGPEDVEAFAQGVRLDDGYVTLPAQLTILGRERGKQIISQISLTITEGKFHQVKRMFQAVGKKVIFLKRVSMGHLLLDGNLPEGACRELTNEELKLLGAEI
ncbi:16S rRNA pseudouridine516 synthase [Paenibacillus forsythiae]|uniref:Pseudouridine synthase n=1 Tax=Paenibacillus forsythiae TaxID=365616 RepID=A0ABU3H7X8_9BACL|nr:pseudouridine synthase [Paenibacillus forsythiae]MDT3426904.1 16S rRNA pseudouridine516 synthase [Paenibacillus forsythiae]